MDDDDFAAYDPLFWFHHTNLDRIWARWQKAHPEGTVPESFLNVTMQPFAVMVRDMVDIDRLGYAYDGDPSEATIARRA